MGTPGASWSPNSCCNKPRRRVLWTPGLVSWRSFRRRSPAPQCHSPTSCGPGPVWVFLAEPSTCTRPPKLLSSATVASFHGAGRICEHSPVLGPIPPTPSPPSPSTSVVAYLTPTLVESWRAAWRMPLCLRRWPRNSAMHSYQRRHRAPLIRHFSMSVRSSVHQRHAASIAHCARSVRGELTAAKTPPRCRRGSRSPKHGSPDHCGRRVVESWLSCRKVR